MTSTTRFRKLGLLAAGAVLVSACGSSAATPAAPATPAATPAPVATPAPTPTPVDVGATVLQTIQASDYSASFTLKGSGTFGAQAITSTGTWDTSGGDSHAVTNITMGAQSWTTDSIEVGGKSWDSSAGGPFIASANTSCNTMIDALRLAKALKDEGTVTKGGKSVHHLTIDGGVDASCSAPTSTSVTDMKIAVDIYAADDGSIVSITQATSWSQTSAGSPFTASLTTEATPTGQPAAAITAPKDPWSLYEDSTYNFRVAVPAGWDEEMYDNRPSLRDPDHKYILEFIVSPVPAGMTLADYAKADRQGLNSLKALKVNTTQDADLGGEAGGLLEFHYTSGTTPIHSLDVYALHGGNSYDLFWGSAPGAEKADYTMFSNIVNSFVFTK